MNLDDVAVFLAVARERSITSAARTLELPKSTVSERLARLEKALGVRLFDRTTRSLALTLNGAEYFERVRPLVDGLEEANAAVAAAHRAPRGLIRVGAPILVAQSFLADLVGEFMERYPDIAVELLLQENASAFDLAHDRLDLAIHVFGHIDPSLVAKKLGSVERVLVASPAYVRQHGAPRTPAEILEHSAVVVGASRKMRWTCTNGKELVDVDVTGRYAVTSIELVQRGILRGLGVGTLPTFLCAEHLHEKKLVRVLEGWSLLDTVVQVVYPSGSRMSARTRAFADLLTERVTAKFASMPRYAELGL